MKEDSKKNNLKKIIESYAKIVANRPFFVLFIVFIFILIALYFVTQVNYSSQDFSEMIPDNYDVVKAYGIIEDSFKNPNTIMIFLQIDREYITSNEVKDIRDLEVLKYIDVLTKYLEGNEFIENVNSLSNSLRKINNGYLPKSKYQISDLISENEEIKSLVSDDYTMSIINISLSDQYSDDKDSLLVDNLEKIIIGIKHPSGLKINVTGSIASYPVMDKELGPDMQKTGNFSIIGIFFVLIMIFVIGEISIVFRQKQSLFSKIIKIIGTLRFGLTPLLTILIGIVWTFGFLGLIKMGVTSVTSGVVSMIMGIGIDFGIQTVIRFRQELKNKLSIEKAMINTLTNVILPMATTAIAALIGFKAMSMGELSFVGDLGKIMSYGVTFCFFAAITIVPAILVLLEKLFKFLRINVLKEKND
ncbi:MAG: MMPL family transporter [Candidatus ainarchaeum sp.]|nr:MMPL family transporter [Candidatus ainarchaeum sp.]MDD3976320.1 MMPL family transporter [Candidatus ainarchaeum sp.]